MRFSAVRKYLTPLFLVTMMVAAISPSVARATRLKDLCAIQGAQENTLTGIGLVVGLAGTGDSAKDALNRQQRMLDRLNIDVETIGNLASDNIAVVMVDAVFPAFGKQGTQIDVRVSSLYDCESLEGGTLLETMLYGMDKEVYAVSRGPLSIGGFNADAGGGSVRKNHVTVGRIPMGATIEREIPSTITDGERITLQLKRPDFITANKIQEAINSSLNDAVASALGAGAINVKIPLQQQSDLVAFIALLQGINVQPDFPGRVVINERTGTLVIGGDVMIRPCQVAHGNLTVKIDSESFVSQPEPFSPGGETVVTEEQTVDVLEGEAYFNEVKGTSAGDVAMSLNKLKVSPRDMIAIFQALREAGALDADLEIM